MAMITFQSDMIEPDLRSSIDEQGARSGHEAGD